MITTKKSDRWQYVGFNDTWFVLLGIPLLTLVLTILFYSGQEFPEFNLWIRFLGGLPFTTLYWVVTREVMKLLRKKYKEHAATIKRITLVAFFILFVSPFIGAILNTLLNIISESIGYERVAIPVFSSKKIFPVYFSCFFMVAVYEAIYFYIKLKETIEEREAAKQAQIKSELEGLRSQVNPHFLFNSMNTLMNIVLEDQQLAVNFLGKLSKVYRYILESREEQIIPLQKELEFINAYTFLQKERFRGSLEVDIRIPDNFLLYHIIPLSLQILFENAIKHNSVSQKKPLLIEVFVEADTLIVRNNLQRKEQVMDSTKFGLENIETRYRFFTQKSIRIEETNNHFLVAIPLLPTSQIVKNYS